MQVLRDTREGENRGEFERAKAMFDMRKLATQEIRRDGEAQAMPVHVASSMGVPAAFADVREAQAGCAGCRKCACGLGQQEVSA